MREDVALRWAAALRSGQYKQGRKFLRQDDSHFCALGVLVDIYLKDTKQDWFFANDWGHYEALDEVSTIPDEVRSWADMDSCTGAISKHSDLVQMNDVAKLSFRQIADVIEQNTAAL